MMTKYTDEEIIAYLKTLREGDVLTATKTDDSFTKGRHYVVSKDKHDDLRLRRDLGGAAFIHIGADYRRSVHARFRLGIFEIPTPAIASKPFHIDITSYTLESHSATQYIEIEADGAGLARLFELEAEGKRSRDLVHLYAKRAELQADIDRLEAK